MSFIRAEAAETLSRWRDALLGVVLFGFSLFGVFTAYGVVFALSCIGLIAGPALIWEGVKRARWPADGGGPGLVEVDERRITYLTSSGGNAVSIDQMQRVEVERTSGADTDAPFKWHLYSDDALRLDIPSDAEGAVALFDAIAALPGADYAAIERATSGSGSPRQLVWERPRPRLH